MNQENQNVEWKESWHDEYLKWICGFANAQGDYDTALLYFEQSLAISQQIGDIAGLAATLNNMGIIFFEQKNDIEQAVACFMQSYQICQKIGSPNIKKLQVI